jgi:hypothetical protein
MAETMSLKALARQILARECERSSVFPGAPRPIAAALLPAPIDAIAPPARVVTLAGGEPGLDQPCAARRGRIEILDSIFLHFCDECGRFGAFGYGVSLRAGRLGRWYCGEHRPTASQVEPQNRLKTG